ncbi:hypothetical protein SAMN00790413_04252 [Deinococcus hopiensis KR-140]|uniref:Uncharacterized protein n=1 Tax=Deinococcus hopiensis KR-140 TaxID=695939 RepID=A0A1W1UPU2_9DEIO|nr:hypothetical protein SAMN00790413_04252 [Deinococcus hopiensis KR-140]
MLPRIDALVQKAISNVRADGRPSMAEALALATEVRNIVSLVIGQMLPQIEGTSARKLLSLVLAVLRQYNNPSLPLPPCGPTSRCRRCVGWSAVWNRRTRAGSSLGCRSKARTTCAIY